MKTLLGTATITPFDGPLYTVQGEDQTFHCFNTRILLTFPNGEMYFLKHEVPGHIDPPAPKCEEDLDYSFPRPNRQYKEQAQALIDKIFQRGEVDLQHWVKYEPYTMEQILKEEVYAENQERAEVGASLIPTW